MLSASDIVEIHEILTDWFAASEDPISPPGLKSTELLQSAAARPYQTVDGKDAYSSTFEKAAALFHSLVNNHCFHNGNKRVALVAAQAFLADENYWLEHASDEEMFEFTRQAAAHELVKERTDELKYISEWMANNSRKVVRGEHPLKYGELRSILKRFGFHMDLPSGDLVDIYKDEARVERIIKQGIQGFRPYHTDYISGLRKRLGLTAENGIDSNVFYGERNYANSASEFIELRIEVMRRLAKT